MQSMMDYRSAWYFSTFICNYKLCYMYSPKIYFQQQHLVSYWETSSPAKSKKLDSVSIVRLDMKWRTMYNKVDSGVFAINHMETYKGNGLRNWECKFAYEKVRPFHV